jgi:hypothetical protein
VWAGGSVKVVELFNDIFILYSYNESYSFGNQSPGYVIPNILFQFSRTIDFK